MGPAVEIPSSGTSLLTNIAAAAYTGGPSHRLAVQRFDSHGATVGLPIAFDQNAAGTPDWATLAMAPNGRFVVAWEDGGAFARAFEADGTPATENIRLDSTSSFTRASAAIDSDGNFVAVWDEANPANSHIEVHARRFDPDGQAVGSAVVVNSDDRSVSQYPDVAWLPEGGFAVGWVDWSFDGRYGIYGRLFDSSATAIDNPFLVDTRAPTILTASSVLSIGTNVDGDVAFSWVGPDSGNGSAMLRVYGGDEPLFSTRTVASSPQPLLGDTSDVILDENDVATLVWSLDGYEMPARLQQFGASGTPLAPSISINSADPEHGAVNVSLADVGAGHVRAAWQNYQNVTIREFELTDNTAPFVTSASYDYQRSGDVVFQLSEPVSGTGYPSVTLRNVDTGLVVPSSLFSIYKYASGEQVIVRLSCTLPDGNYRATLSATGVTDHAGHPLAGNATVDFFLLAGDANRDRKVDVSDLGILASNWQQTLRTFALGDFNYDGKVDVTDLGILATNWQKTLPIPQ